MPSPGPAPLTFDKLARRLVRDLAKLVRSGAVTERRLASMVGLSQSHLHNVVNGQRTLTPTVADQVMDRLDWSLLDLVESAEAHALLNRRQASLAHGCEIPLHRRGVGPGFSLPGVEFTEISVPNFWLARAEIPFAVSVDDDPAMDLTINEGDILFVDRSARVRLQLYDDALYIVRWRGESLIRWLRFSSTGLYLITAEDWSEPLCWTHVTRPASERLAIVEAQVIAVSRPPDGTFRRPVPPSGSN